MTTDATSTAGARDIDTSSVRRNPYNPRLFFNEESLDLLRTSIQEVGILVPLIVYADSKNPGEYVLLDGERRWRCALDLGLEIVPVNVIREPSHLDNILRMFNIHSVRENWPLISVALSLRQVMEIAGETRESRLADMTGLTRTTVRRAKHLLTLPEYEIELMREEAHLNRTEQVHREDLYLEILAVEPVLRRGFPEIADSFSRAEIIRKFAEKREVGSLKAVTEFRVISKILKAANTELVARDVIVAALKNMVDNPEVSPSSVFDGLLAASYRQTNIFQKSRALLEDLNDLQATAQLSNDLREALIALRDHIDRLVAGE